MLLYMYMYMTSKLMHFVEDAEFNVVLKTNRNCVMIFFFIFFFMFMIDIFMIDKSQRVPSVRNY